MDFIHNTINRFFALNMLGDEYRQSLREYFHEYVIYFIHRLVNKFHQKEKHGTIDR